MCIRGSVLRLGSHVTHSEMDNSKEENVSRDPVDVSASVNTFTSRLIWRSTGTTPHMYRIKTGSVSDYELIKVCRKRSLAFLQFSLECSWLVIALLDSICPTYLKLFLPYQMYQ